MGHSHLVKQRNNMIKIALLVCSAALAATDADALYGAYGYGGHLGYGAGHLGYGVGHLGYAGLGHHGVGYGVSIHGAAPAAIPAVHGGYAGAGRYVANSVGAVHVAKREAEAEPEADADALYGAYGYGGYSLGHRAYSVGYGLGHGYSTLGYGHGYGLGYARYGYGKRSADAEPEAEADALYGAYGYGGYGLGHRTYSVGYGHGYGLGHGYSTLGHGYGYGRGFGFHG